MQDAILDQRFETAGIDDQIRLAPELAMTVMTVPGKARHIGNNGIARLGQPVEKRGFADIRAADQD